MAPITACGSGRSRPCIRFQEVNSAHTIVAYTLPQPAGRGRRLGVHHSPFTQRPMIPPRATTMMSTPRASRLTFCSSAARAMSRPLLERRRFRAGRRPPAQRPVVCCPSFPLNRSRSHHGVLCCSTTASTNPTVGFSQGLPAAPVSSRRPLPHSGELRIRALCLLRSPSLSLFLRGRREDRGRT